MKISIGIIIGLLLIILISNVYAICPVPDISTYNTCTSGCPDAVKYTEKFATCINTCLSSWNKIQDAYRACQKSEAEQKVLEEQELNQTTRVSSFRGNVSILHKDGTRESVSKITALKKGDQVQTGPGGYAVIEIPGADHAIEIGQESSFRYNVEGGSIVDLLFGRLRMKILKRMLRPGETISGGGIHSQITMPGTAAGAIRGTDFIAENYDNIARFYVQEGIVDVTNNKNETFEVDAWEMITVYPNGSTVESELSATNWYGLLNSIQVGVPFTPTFETAAEEQKESESGEQKTNLPVLPIVIVIIIALAIIFGALLIKKQKKK